MFRISKWIKIFCIIGNILKELHDLWEVIITPEPDEENPPDSEIPELPENPIEIPDDE